MPVVLWTDALIYLLVGVVLLLAWHARGREHLRAPWRRVACSRMGVASGTVLAAFLAIGLLDSVHFLPYVARDAETGAEPAYSTEVISAFDWLMSPVRERVEKTYSAPLATHAYTKEMIDLPAGRQIRDFPRLRYGGAHLADPRDRWADIGHLTLAGVLEGLAVWTLVAAGLLALRAWRQGERLAATAAAVWGGRTEVPWRTLLLTVAVLVISASVLASVGVRYHVLGTDKVGQDVLYLSLKSRNGKQPAELT